MVEAPDAFFARVGEFIGGAEVLGAQAGGGP
jgi:hypothetical protein